jgi:hypothetical protein
LRTSAIVQNPDDAIRQTLAILREEEKTLAAKLERVRVAISAILPLVGEGEEATDRGTMPSTTGPAGTGYNPYTLAQAAQAALREAHRPLHTRELNGLLQAKGILTEGDERGRKMLADVLWRRANNRDTFARVGTGVYSLREWGATNVDDEDAKTDQSQEGMSMK